jgi:endo-beta-N-acetylglucosaminidase D
MTREMNSKTEQSVTPEQQKKLQDKVDKCKQDVQKVLPCWRWQQGSTGPWSK